MINFKITDLTPLTINISRKDLIEAFKQQDNFSSFIDELIDKAIKETNKQ